jgi:LPXTG-motif cell wall-anchored protein
MGAVFFLNPRPSRTFRAIATVTLIICLGVAAPAGAVGKSSLPDPNGSKSAKAGNTSAAADKSGNSGKDLPTTGLPAGVLVTAGLTLLAAGGAILPARRRRRTYDAGVWRRQVSRLSE